LKVDRCVVPWTQAGTEELRSVRFHAAAAGITLTPDAPGLVADATATPSDPAAALATFPGQALADRYNLVSMRLEQVKRLYGEK
jgi:hypothetical protein